MDIVAKSIRLIRIFEFEREEGLPLLMLTLCEYGERKSEMKYKRPKQP